MKVICLKDCELGKKGEFVEHPESWRRCFPCKGCVAQPADNEAVNRIQRELAGCDPTQRKKNHDAMQAAGSLELYVEPKKAAKPKTEDAPASTPPEAQTASQAGKSK